MRGAVGRVHGEGRRLRVLAQQRRLLGGRLRLPQRHLHASWYSQGSGMPDLCACAGFQEGWMNAKPMRALTGVIFSGDTGQRDCRPRPTGLGAAICHHLDKFV